MPDPFMDFKFLIHDLGIISMWKKSMVNLNIHIEAYYPVIEATRGFCGKFMKTNSQYQCYALQALASEFLWPLCPCLASQQARSLFIRRPSEYFTNWHRGGKTGNGWKERNLQNLLSLTNYLFSSVRLYHHKNPASVTVDPPCV